MRVLLVDDHRLVRGVLARFLSRTGDIQVVGEAGDGIEAVAAARKLRPDVVLMDIRMPVSDGIEATRRIKEEMPGTKIVALTVSEEMSDLVKIFQSGAEGYVLKSVAPEDLVASLRRIAGEETALSPRETDILRLVAEGASNREISARLSMSESAVRNHLHHLLGKLHVRNRLQAALFAESRGLISISGP